MWGSTTCGLRATIFAFEEPERASTGSRQFTQLNPTAPQSFEAEFVSHGSSESTALERWRAAAAIYMSITTPAPLPELLGWRQEAAEAALDRVCAVEEHAPRIAGGKDQAASLTALVDTPRVLATELAERVKHTGRLSVSSLRCYLGGRPNHQIWRHIAHPAECPGSARRRSLVWRSWTTLVTAPTPKASTLTAAGVHAEESA
jgi:hypothetical protein